MVFFTNVEYNYLRIVKENAHYVQIYIFSRKENNDAWSLLFVEFSLANSNVSAKHMFYQGK